MTRDIGNVYDHPRQRLYHSLLLPTHSQTLRAFWFNKSDAWFGEQIIVHMYLKRLHEIVPKGPIIEQEHIARINLCIVYMFAHVLCIYRHGLSWPMENIHAVLAPFT